MLDHILDKVCGIGMDFVFVSQLDQPNHALQFFLEERAQDHLVTKINLSLQGPLVDLLLLFTVGKELPDGFKQLGDMYLSVSFWILFLEISSKFLNQVSLSL